MIKKLPEISRCACGQMPRVYLDASGLVSVRCYCGWKGPPGYAGARARRGGRAERRSAIKAWNEGTPKAREA